MTGRVVSVKMQKSAVVLVESKKTHPLYKKSYAWSKKYIVDDPIGVVLGDLVEIIKIRPMSKNKHFRISKVLGKDFVAIAEEQLKESAEEAIEEVMPEEKIEVVVEDEKLEEPSEEEKSLEKKKTAKKVVVKKEKKDGTA